MYITVGRHQWHAPRRLLGGGRTRSLALVLSLSVLSVLVFFVLLPSEWQDVVLPLHRQPAPRRMPVAQPLPPLPDRVPCYGPRRRLLSESPDDELRSAHLDIPYPVPFIGSYDELGLERTWMTPEDRYGPYGYGEEDDDYGRERVSWDAVNWARLQNSCFDRNEARFPAAARWFTNEPRFALRGDSRLPLVRTWDEFNATRRTAIVVRTYNGYRYKPEDMHNLRALVTEASLRTGGEYAVVLLVNIRGPESNVTRSREAYDEAFRKADIPPEFRSIAILWDESLLRSWYPKVEEYRTEWQVFQPLQLFALHYPEFDHYWQLEMDMRFLGDAGQYLDAVSAFARREPRKQALERSTFPLVTALTGGGSYANLSAAVDAANRGGSHAWGPLRIPDVAPIGPVPPVRRPEDDDFRWGVGEDADVVTTSFCANVTTSAWVYRGWIRGFPRGGGRGSSTPPRVFCPPAIMRASRALLLAVHAAQAQQGMRIPSEATLPSFALWHGLKISYPPQPLFLREPGRVAEAAAVRGWVYGFGGGGPEASEDGMGHGNPQQGMKAGGNGTSGLTWWWEGRWPREIVDAWYSGPDSRAEEKAARRRRDASAVARRDEEDDAWPYLLAVREGRVYAPNVALHPVKTQ